MDTINRFINAQIKRYGSARRVAEHVGLSHQTINDLSAYKPTDALPSMQTVIKLARGTGSDPLYIFALLLKEREDIASIGAEERILVQQIKELPAEYRQIIIDLARVAIEKKKDNA